MSDSEFDPERIFAAFSNEDVRFILIGGMAAILHGDAGVTIDIDIVPAVDSANLDHLAKALRSLDARIRAEVSPTASFSTVRENFCEISDRTLF